MKTIIAMSFILCSVARSEDARQKTCKEIAQDLIQLRAPLLSIGANQPKLNGQLEFSVSGKPFGQDVGDIANPWKSTVTGLGDADGDHWNLTIDSNKDVRDLSGKVVNGRVVRTYKFRPSSMSCEFQSLSITEPGKEKTFDLAGCKDLIRQRQASLAMKKSKLLGDPYQGGSEADSYATDCDILKSTFPISSEGPGEQPTTNKGFRK